VVIVVVLAPGAADQGLIGLKRALPAHGDDRLLLARDYQARHGRLPKNSMGLPVRLVWTSGSLPLNRTGKPR
jgi:hypothetical protein